MLKYQKSLTEDTFIIFYIYFSKVVSSWILPIFLKLTFILNIICYLFLLFTFFVLFI